MFFCKETPASWFDLFLTSAKPREPYHLLSWSPKYTDFLSGNNKQPHRAHHITDPQAALPLCPSHGWTRTPPGEGLGRREAARLLGALGPGLRSVET